MTNLTKRAEKALSHLDLIMDDEDALNVFKAHEQTIRECLEAFAQAEEPKAWINGEAVYTAPLPAERKCGKPCTGAHWIAKPDNPGFASTTYSAVCSGCGAPAVLADQIKLWDSLPWAPPAYEVARRAALAVPQELAKERQEYMEWYERGLRADRCPHGVRHPHPCRECEDTPLKTDERDEEIERLRKLAEDQDVVIRRQRERRLEQDAEIERLRTMLLEVLETGGLANDLVRDRIEEALKERP